jgi:hypothetical protein
VKKFFLIAALLGCALVYLQQQSYAEKVAHKEYAKMEIKECNSCHKSEGIAPNHDADWVRGHRVLASRANAKCKECHEQKWCLDCHQGGGSGDDLSVENFRRDYKPKSHRSDFLSLHPLKALDNKQSCFRCHDEKAFCNSCHSRFPAGKMQIKSHLMLGPDHQTYKFSVGEHSIEARRNLQSCAACHPEGDVCIQCHSSGKVSPHPRNWKAISGNISSRTNGKTCKKCH